MSLVQTAKRLLRPLIPDRVIARYRIQQHSRHSRVNIDVFLDDEKTAKRWLATTPDTYRVRMGQPRGPTGAGLVISVDDTLPVDEDLIEAALAIASDPEIGAAVVGEVAKPGLVDRRRAEPVVGPRLIVTSAENLTEIGGVPPGDHPLPGLLARLRDAGLRIGLLPVPVSGAPAARSDPIDPQSIVILAAVPMHDVGGGARSTQLALEFLGQGYHVTLVSLYEAQESVDLGLRYVHPELEQYRVERFEVPAFAERVANPGLVLVEAPASPLVEKAASLEEEGWSLVYDIIDDWSDPALGGDWYRPSVEEQLILKADRVVASAPDLIERAKRMGRDADLVPNAVNAGIFGVDLPPRPEDLPEAEPIIGYHGSLYGDWFDWDSVRDVAEAFPAAAVVLIGDDKAPRPEMPDNVHFLGLKPQTALPAYIQRFDVGIIPFKVNATTHAVSPLKAYEYLASGVPIAAPPLRALDGLVGTHLADDLKESVSKALSAPRPDRLAVLKRHSWAARATRINGAEDSPGEDNSISPTQRPVIHYSRGERR